MTAERPSAFASVTGFVARWRRARAAIRTERILSGLPRSIRKDIGWPDHWDVSADGRD